MEEITKESDAIRQMLALESKDKGDLDFSAMRDGEETVDTKEDVMSNSDFRKFTNKLFKLLKKIK